VPRPGSPGDGPAPGAPPLGTVFRPTRDLAAKREAYYAAKAGFTPGPGSPASAAARPALPSRPRVPGERQYRDGDRVHHGSFGEGTVVTSKLTRDDEQVTVAFPDRGVKVLMASLANLELVG